MLLRAMHWRRRTVQRARPANAAFHFSFCHCASVMTSGGWA
jgi:hypothetical protein